MRRIRPNRHAVLPGPPQRAAGRMFRLVAARMPG
ncbi:hypothetical protein BJY16_001487 [Actinoplanes octamycinicus]|uniref:Uncharacterized protein n=1 Tax=Actinoplanes octamycinicus TaxID=135948 RepID=A0A7W7GTI2_9ACTN|nr:hypothetical protein [Actinoplanes octamycinicus]